VAEFTSPGVLSQELSVPRLITYSGREMPSWKAVVLGTVTLRIVTEVFFLFKGWDYVEAFSYFSNPIKE
jgi:hypothetical protein